jgi:hypothetical protein
MANIHLKRLKQEAKARFRSLNQEATARLSISFDLEDKLTAPETSRLIQEALDSGPAKPFSFAAMDKLHRETMKKAKGRKA